MSLSASKRLIRSARTIAGVSLLLVIVSHGVSYNLCERELSPYAFIWVSRAAEVSCPLLLGFVCVVWLFCCGGDMVDGLVSIFVCNI